MLHVLEIYICSNKTSLRMPQPAVQRMSRNTRSAILSLQLGGDSTEFACFRSARSRRRTGIPCHHQPMQIFSVFTNFWRHRIPRHREAFFLSWVICRCIALGCHNSEALSHLNYSKCKHLPVQSQQINWAISPTPSLSLS